MRDVKATSGLQIAPTANTDLKALRKITLITRSQDINRVNHDVPLEFDVWPRN